MDLACKLSRQLLISSNVKTRLLNIDLASFKSIRKAVAEVNSWGNVPYVDLLVNNVMAVPYGKTEDGFERHFGTNDLGHFLFTSLILPKILDSITPRVVRVSSYGHRSNPIRWTDYNYSASYAKRHGSMYQWKRFSTNNPAI